MGDETPPTPLGRLLRSLAGGVPGVGLGLVCYAALDYGAGPSAFVGALGAFIGAALTQPGVSAGRIFGELGWAVVAHNLPGLLRDDALDRALGDSTRPARPLAPEGPAAADDSAFPDSVPGRADYPLTAGPVAFAVISPVVAVASELRDIGRRLKAWQEADPRVVEIVGLEQLLAGQVPETPAWHFLLSTPPETEKVALVFVTGEAATEATTQELTGRLRGCPIAMLVSPAYYAAINR